MRPYLLGSTNNIQNCKTKNQISTQELKPEALFLVAPSVTIKICQHLPGTITTFRTIQPPPGPFSDYQDLPASSWDHQLPSPSLIGLYCHLFEPCDIPKPNKVFKCASK